MRDSVNRGRASQVGRNKQERASMTRRELLRSARAIFARDGFEHARLADIATRAGKSRGAVYANFTDKEDIFFAIFEEDTARDQKELAPLLKTSQSVEARVVALGVYLGKLCKDRERILLGMEFKLYAIRHPRQRKRLANLHAAMRLRFSMGDLKELLPELDRQSPTEQRSGTFTMSGVLEGLALNCFFEPNVLSEDQLAQYLCLCVRNALLDPPQAPSA